MRSKNTRPRTRRKCVKRTSRLSVPQPWHGTPASGEKEMISPKRVVFSNPTSPQFGHGPLSSPRSLRQFEHRRSATAPTVRRSLTYGKSIRSSRTLLTQHRSQARPGDKEGLEPAPLAQSCGVSRDCLYLRVVRKDAGVGRGAGVSFYDDMRGFRILRRQNHFGECSTAAKLPLNAKNVRIRPVTRVDALDIRGPVSNEPRATGERHPGRIVVVQQASHVVARERYPPPLSIGRETLEEVRPDAKATHSGQRCLPPQILRLIIEPGV